MLFGTRELVYSTRTKYSTLHYIILQNASYWKMACDCVYSERVFTSYHIGSLHITSLRD